MKIRYIIFFLLFLFQSMQSQQLTVMLEPDIKEFMRDMYFVNASTGWMVGNEGAIYKTSDGGNTWALQNSGVTKDLNKVFFVNDNTGWVGSISGSVLKTTDGGATWTETIFGNVRPFVTFSLMDILYFTDENTGFISAGALRNIYLFKTTDGGSNWAVVDSLVSTVDRRWYDMSFTGAQGMVVGNRNNIQKISKNSGQTWTLAGTINDGFFGMQRSVHWLDLQTVVTMGEGQEFGGIPTPIYKSVDTGKTWTKVSGSLTFNKYDRIKEGYFKDSQNGIGVGNNGFSRVFIVNTTDGGSTWSSSTADYPVGLQAISGFGDTILAFGSSGRILKSTDFGANWTGFPYKTAAALYGVDFKGNNGFAVTSGGDFYFSSDKGKTWSRRSSTGANNAYALTFLDETTGFVHKENRHIVKTTDAGLTWRTVLEPVVFNSRNKVGGITFGDSQTGYAWMSLDDYANYFIFKTTDGGETWVQNWTGTGPGYISGNMVAFDANHVSVLGPDRWLLSTTDGGTTWAQATQTGFPDGFATKDFESVVKFGESKAYAVGIPFIAYTSDKGQSWSYVDHGLTGIDSSFYTITFYSDTLGYIGCFDGTIVKAVNGGLSWVADTTYREIYMYYSSGMNSDGRLFFGTSDGMILAGPEIVSGIDEFVMNPSGFELAQNYPNPFNPETNISFTLSSPGIVSLGIYDLLGNEAAVLFNEYKSAGSHSVKFNPALYRLSSGVYFYKLRSGGKMSVKKMIYIQ
ncbi:MAG: T9SS type A sorting domain-containing protein [Ignavibacteriaceae bacterium]|nr:T9SS type A sorting domain-containing protein [Ignavibacteriaceae bacterium]